jgi:SP family arabinose:H+ symporter-like MFS transporter
LAINKYVLRSTIVGALGGLLFGFDTANISGTTAALTAVFHLGDLHLNFPFLHNVSELGITVSIALFGTVIGAPAAGSLGQRYGSREMLRLTAILYLGSSIGCAFAPTWGLLLIAWFVGGLGIGGSSVLGPVYIAELAPAHPRGRLVGVFQINIVIGILLAYLSNYIITLINVGSTEWRWELGIAAFPAAIFFVLLYTIPRSARWLTTRIISTKRERSFNSWVHPIPTLSWLTSVKRSIWNAIRRVHPYLSGREGDFGMANQFFSPLPSEPSIN